MKRILIMLGIILTLVLLVAGGIGGWYVYEKLPQRQGKIQLSNLSETVTVRYDERGVPHIKAKNEADMYRALGYVQAQDRLFQMEMLRRLANGELAEVLGPGYLDSDKLFRTLGLGAVARDQAAAMNPASPASKALIAYLDGVNQFQKSHPAPVEFDLLHLPQRPFTTADSYAVNAYFAYSFAAAFKTAPVLTYIRDKLGPPYLAAFDTEWHPLGAVQSLAQGPSSTVPNQRVALADADWHALRQLAHISRSADALAGITQFQGSNAWVISGQRTASGKPLLAGDPHLSFAAPSVWYEAQLSCPGFDLYGHYMALSPHALLGHNEDFGWSLTLLENGDIDLIAEKVNPLNANQVWQQDHWVDLGARTETIHVKDAADVLIKVRQSPHGPIVTDAVATGYGRTPIAMWWTYQQTDNTFADALYALNRSDTRELARNAASQIHAPGLNVVWANASGDIGWWAAALIPQRPDGVNPMFILDAGKGEAEKLGFYNFNFNPQEENPPRGYIVSANQQPASVIPIPGFYRLPDRYMEIDRQLQDPKRRWTVEDTKLLQLDACNGYPKRLLTELLPVMDQVLTDANERAFMEPLHKWDGCFDENSVAATLFSQFSYELARAIFADKLDPEQFQSLLQSPALDLALPRLAADANAPWWVNTTTQRIENRYETVRIAWSATLQHMEKLYGTNLLDWTWGKTHTLTHQHLLGTRFPYNRLFNVGPFFVPGGRETPSNFSGPIGPGPWAVTYGPSTRRIIDFAQPDQAQGINPLGQSGVPFDRHYADQAKTFAEGGYATEHLTDADVRSHTHGVLKLRPASGP